MQYMQYMKYMQNNPRKTFYANRGSNCSEFPAIVAARRHLHAVCHGGVVIDHLGEHQEPGGQAAFA
jgi:hypothetical protein